MSATLLQSAANGAEPHSLPVTTSAPAQPEPRKSSKAPAAKTQGFTWHETLIGTASITFWIILIDFGYLVRSSDYRYQLGQMQAHNFGRFITDALMLLLSFSVSNVALLCCLCGFLGAMADRSDIDGDERDSGSWANHTQKYMSAILRGFFVFLVLMSGMILMSGTDLSVTTPQSYGHLAGTASLFSFLIGWDAQLFTKFVKKVYDKEWMDTRQTDAAAQQKVDKHSVDTAPDGSRHEEISHAVTSASLSSASVSNGNSLNDATRKPSPTEAPLSSS